MCPEYGKVIIPQQHADRFEGMVRRMGGCFDSKINAQDAIQEERTTRWITLSDFARRQVDLSVVRLQTDPVVETVINTGISDLVSDAIAMSARYQHQYQLKGLQEYNVSAIRRVLMDAFGTSLPEDVPNYYKLRSSRQGNVLSRTREVSDRFSPTEIVCLIERYGLIGDGKREVREIATDHNMSVPKVNGSINNGLRIARRLLISGEAGLLI